MNLWVILPLSYKAITPHDFLRQRLLHTANRTVELRAVKQSEPSVAHWAMVVLLAILGMGALGGGLWLILLGGSWYYAVAGLLFLATLIWALWEVGLDWWPLSARGDVIAVVGFLPLWLAGDQGGRFGDCLRIAEVSRHRPPILQLNRFREDIP